MVAGALFDLFDHINESKRNLIEKEKSVRLSSALENGGNVVLKQKSRSDNGDDDDVDPKEENEELYETLGCYFCDETSAKGGGGEVDEDVSEITGITSKIKMMNLEDDVEAIFNPNEWRNVLDAEDWETLLEMLENYPYELLHPPDPNKYSSKKPKRRLRVVKAAIWMKDKAAKPIQYVQEKRGRGDQPIPLDPLLALTPDTGEAPLHLALHQSCPEAMLIKLLFCQKKVAMVPDLVYGRLPLHWACIYERETNVVDRLIRSNASQLQWQDFEGKTPLLYAIEQAKLRAIQDLTEEEEALQKKGKFKPLSHSSSHHSQRPLTFYWGKPRSRAEVEWQERQEGHWFKAQFLLLCYSTRRKVAIPAEKAILLDILKHAGPPKLLETAILASQGLLHTQPLLATKALDLFMQREYPIKNLQLLLHHFPEENAESMEAARKTLTNMYHKGCRVLPGRIKTFREEMEQHALDPTYRRTLSCLHWWDKMVALLKLCGHANHREKRKQFDLKFLLHAALTNCDCPPALVQLLMVMYPEVISLPHPFTGALLIHLISRNWKYNLYPHSKNLGVYLEMEEPPMVQVLKIVLAADKSLCRKRFKDRLPIHNAVMTNKSIAFLEALIEADVETLSVRDPITKLYPFQEAALPDRNSRAALWAHAKHSPVEWKGLGTKGRRREVDKVRKEHDLEQLTNIFYLLRACPSVATGAVLVDQGVGQRKASEFRDNNGKGMISAHYLVLLYHQDEVDRSVWILNKDALTDLRRAIRYKSIPESMAKWWDKLKFWIRYCYDLPHDFSVPKGSDIDEDEYLVHACIGNSDCPPLIMELLLAIYPRAASLPVPNYAGPGKLYPLHMAAATPAYQPQHFENFFSSSSIVSLLVDAYPDAGRILGPGGIPLDIAQAEGKTEEECKPLMAVTIQHTIQSIEQDMDEDFAAMPSISDERSFLCDTSCEDEDSTTAEA